MELPYEIFNLIFSFSLSFLRGNASLRRQFREQRQVADQASPADPLDVRGVSPHGGFAQSVFPFQETDLAFSAGAPPL